MIQVFDLKHHTPRGSAKEFWRFSLVLPLHGGEELETRGWRYWPGSGHVAPPMTTVRGKPYWLIKPSSTLVNTIRTLVESQLGGVNAPGELAQARVVAEKLGYDEAKRRFPKVFRELILEDCSPEEKKQFDSLPADRLWPDLVISGWAKQIQMADKSADDVAWEVEEGVISNQDRVRLIEILKGEQDEQGKSNF